MIRIEHVEKSYGKRPVLKDVSLEVPTGSVTVIIGPSGSGKTTTLKMSGMRMMNLRKKMKKSFLKL